MYVTLRIGKYVQQQILCFLLQLLMHFVTIAIEVFLLFCRPPNVFEVIAGGLWNDSTFNPIAPASNYHLDFQMATDC